MPVPMEFPYCLPDSFTGAWTKYATIPSLRVGADVVWMGWMTAYWSTTGAAQGACHLEWFTTAWAVASGNVPAYLTFNFASSHELFNMGVGKTTVQGTQWRVGVGGPISDANDFAGFAAITQEPE